jgi:hypothetical protein
MYAVLALLGVLAVNAIPLMAVLAFGWSVFEVLFLYWFENVAIGAAHALRMEISTRTNAVTNDLMFEPYPRVLALHIAVIAGGWLVAEMGAPVWALAILVGVKTAFDFAVAAFFSARTGNVSEAFAALRKRRD